jgi:hypothetical protein
VRSLPLDPGRSLHARRAHRASLVHVYPYETDAKKIWSTNDDDEGHDNMTHSAMPGMKMN